MKAKYSIVVPVYNEEEAIPRFYDAILPVMDKLNEPYEIIFVNDGSKDKTLEILRNLAQKDNRVKYLSFSRNFGQQAAIYCGFEHSTGDAVIDIDVDLQDPVEVLPLMIEKWKEGYEVVHGKRTTRKGETFFKKITSSLYLKFLKIISGLKIPKNVGEFKLFDRKVIDVINSIPDKDKYLRGITAWVGFKQTEVEFVRNERTVGKTNYNLKKLLKLAWSGIISMSTWPMTLSMKFGNFGAFLSFAAFITFTVLVCCGVALPLVVWLFPTITLCFSISFILNGFNNIYITRTYVASQGRPRYIISEKKNFEE